MQDRKKNTLNDSQKRQVLICLIRARYLHADDLPNIDQDEIYQLISLAGLNKTGEDKTVAKNAINLLIIKASIEKLLSQQVEEQNLEEMKKEISDFLGKLKCIVSADEFDKSLAIEIYSMLVSYVRKKEDLLQHMKQSRLIKLNEELSYNPNNNYSNQAHIKPKSELSDEETQDILKRHPSLLLAQHIKENVLKHKIKEKLAGNHQSRVLVLQSSLNRYRSSIHMLEIIGNKLELAINKDKKNENLYKMNNSLSKLIGELKFKNNKINIEYRKTRKVFYSKRVLDDMSELAANTADLIMNAITLNKHLSESNNENDITPNVSFDRSLHRFEGSIKKVRGIDRNNLRVLSGALLCLAGVGLIAGSCVAFGLTFGTSAPLSIAGAALGWQLLTIGTMGAACAFGSVITYFNSKHLARDFSGELGHYADQFKTQTGKAVFGFDRKWS